MDVDALFRAAAADQRQLATRAQLARAGLGRGALARAVADGDLVRVHRSVYAQAELAPAGPHLLNDNGIDAAYLRKVQAALLAGGDHLVAAERTGAVIWQLDMLVEPSSVELAVPPSLTRLALDGVEVRRCGRAPASVIVHGLRVQPVLDVLRACAARRPLVETVTLIDSALRRRRTWLPQLHAAASRGSRLHRAVLLADPRSGSVLESALRVLLVEHGLAPPYSQFVIRGSGRFVARVDFCWPAHRLIVEADGRRWHDPDDRRSSDRRRANACASYGWRVLRFTWAEVLHQPEYVVECVRQALRVPARAQLHTDLREARVPR